MILFILYLFAQGSLALLIPQNGSIINESGNRRSNESLRLFVPPGSTDSIPIYTFHVTINVKDTSGTNFQYCSGALITTTFILTSASCILRGSSLTVVAGVTDGANGGSTPTATPITVAQVIYHPKYEVNTWRYDIALLRLSSAVTLGSTISTVTLPTSSTNYKDSKDFELKTFRVVGFNIKAEGTTWATTTPVTRSYADMTVLSTIDCYNVMKTAHFRIDSTIQSCFSSNTASGSVGTCKGDLGAPIILGNILAGVVSYYGRCGETTVFTRIGPMLSWIKGYLVGGIEV